MSEDFSRRPTIHIVGANPSMDRTQFVESFGLGDVNRAVRVEPMAGGKGLIVARALSRLGTRSAVYGFLGGPTGQYIREECERLNLHDRHTRIEGDTRINPVIVDVASGSATVINEPGPQVSEEEADAFFAELFSSVAPNDFVALSGSLPRGLDAGFATRLVEELGRREVRVIVDTSGAPLQAAVAATPWAIKCNLDEFRVLRPGTPAEVRTDADRRRLVGQMRALQSEGVAIVAITLGAEGAVVASQADAVWVLPPRIKVVNATGSGDTFLAAFLHVQRSAGSLREAARVAVAAATVNAMKPVPDIGEDPDLKDVLDRVVSVPVLDVSESGAAT